MSRGWTTQASIVALDRVEALDDPDGRRFRATGFAPLVTLDLGAERPPGWYAVAVVLEGEAERQVRILPAFGGGIARDRASVLKAVGGDRFTGTFKAPERFRRIALEPGRLPGGFAIAEFSLVRMGPGAVLAMAWAGARRAARRGPLPLLRFLGRALASVLRPGRFETFQPGASLAREDDSDPDARYRDWIARHERAGEPRRPGAPAAPVAVLIPAGDPDATAATLDSLAAGSVAPAELVVAGTAERLAALAPRLDAAAEAGAAATVVRVAIAPAATAAQAVTAALEASASPHLVVLPPGVVARPRLVAAFAEALAARPDLVLAYGDEDRVDAGGIRRAPRFKPAWSPALAEGGGHPGLPVLVARTALPPADAIATAPAGAEDLDLVLRASEAAPAGAILRIPEVLASRTAAAPESGWAAVAPEARGAAVAAAVAARLARTGRRGTVEPVPGLPGRVRVRRTLPEPAPLVSVIVPTRDRADLLAACLDGLATRTAYAPLEILVVDNGSVDPAALTLLAAVDGRDGVRVLRRPGPFNFAALNDSAAAEARGTLLCLVNDDVVPVAPDWLAEMAGLALEPDVGPVGAKLVYPNGTIQHAGILLGMHGTAGHVDVGLPAAAPGPDGRLLAVREVAAVTAACMVVRRSVWTRLGGMDAEAFPVAFNDVDFCLRAGAAGLRCLVTGFAVLTHAESASRGRDDDPVRRARFEAEAARFRARWAAAVLDDPIASPNLDRAEGAILPRR